MNSLRLGNYINNMFASALSTLHFDNLPALSIKLNSFKATSSYAKALTQQSYNNTMIEQMRSYNYELQTANSTHGDATHCLTILMACVWFSPEALASLKIWLVISKLCDLLQICISNGVKTSNLVVSEPNICMSALWWIRCFHSCISNISIRCDSV